MSRRSVVAKPVVVKTVMVCPDCNDEFTSPSIVAAKETREWAQRRFLLGQISREVKEQLDLCADDIEVGHG